MAFPRVSWPIAFCRYIFLESDGYSISASRREGQLAGVACRYRCNRQREVAVGAEGVALARPGGVMRTQEPYQWAASAFSSCEFASMGLAMYTKIVAVARNVGGELAEPDGGTITYYTYIHGTQVQHDGAADDISNSSCCCSHQRSSRDKGRRDVQVVVCT